MVAGRKGGVLGGVSQWREHQKKAVSPSHESLKIGCCLCNVVQQSSTTGVDEFKDGGIGSDQGEQHSNPPEYGEGQKIGV